MTHKRWWWAGAAVGALVALVARGEVPAGLQEVRRHMLDGNTNVLMFHTMDQIFPTRRVENAAPVWLLPRAEAKLDFSYEYGGMSHPASDALEGTFTNALVIVKHGKIVAEIYRNQTDATTHFTSFSMAKSFTSMLIGIALADGAIDSLDDDITRYVPELKASAYEGVTIRQALQMRSGANYHENYDLSHPGLTAATFEESFVQNRVRFAAFARVLTREYPPGEHFNYSTIETAVLGWLLEKATKQSLSQYMSERLWKPAGMESYGFWVLDGEPDVGREIAGSGFNAVARDYARLGLLMLHNGRTRDRQIVPEAWVRESTVPKVRQPIDPHASFVYGYQWWSTTESDAYMAIGLQGQLIYIDPATDTVVVKLSYFPPAKREPFEESLAFMRAASAWNPK